MAAKEKKTKKKSSASGKKTEPATTRRTPAKAEKQRARSKAGKKTSPAPKIPGNDSSDILAEVRDVKAMVGRLVPSTGGADSAVEASADSLRRVLSDLIERRLEPVIREVAEVRSAFPVLRLPEAKPVIARLDTLLRDLGAVRYEAERLDFIDPLIHKVVEERSDKEVADGAILETVRPGYRTARGIIVAKAEVVVNRRP